MVRLFAAKVDNAALDGTGSSGEPTGILNTSGIGDVSTGGTSGNANLTYGNVVDIVTEVSQDNALIGNLHRIVTGKHHRFRKYSGCLWVHQNFQIRPELRCLPWQQRVEPCDS